jgi:hypothetical protein
VSLPRTPSKDDRPAAVLLAGQNFSQTILASPSKYYLVITAESASAEEYEIADKTWCIYLFITHPIYDNMVAIFDSGSSNGTVIRLILLLLSALY